ncbi:MAG TPA: hypothetical protein VGL58_11080 [Caulobacteraceae bacterium]
MKSYLILVFDSREQEPIQLNAEMAHDARAGEFACERLESSRYFTAIEVWRDQTKVFERAA